jgi:hypothetical protein
VPKGDAARKALDSVSSLRVELVSAHGSIVTFQQGAPGEQQIINGHADPQPPRIVEVPFDRDL